MVIPPQGYITLAEFTILLGDFGLLDHKILLQLFGSLIF
jgi:hypothetical protein